jgi:hypothetical protein
MFLENKIARFVQYCRFINGSVLQLTTFISKISFCTLLTFLLGLITGGKFDIGLQTTSFQCIDRFLSGS